MRFSWIGICAVLLLSGILNADGGLSGETTIPEKPAEPVREPLFQAALLRTTLSSGGVSNSASAAFSALLRENLARQKISMEDPERIESVLKGHTSLPAETDSSAYATFGKALHSRYLLVPHIRRFDVKNTAVRLAPGGKALLRRIGILEGGVTILRADDGKMVRTIPFSERIDFSSLPEKTDNWDTLRCYNHLMKSAAAKAATETGKWLRNPEKLP